MCTCLCLWTPGVIHATPMLGENATQVIAHCLEAWAAWGKPQQIKTDSGPAYTGQKIASFCQCMGVHLTHGHTIHKAKALWNVPIDP